MASAPPNLGQIMGIKPGSTGTFVATGFDGVNGTGNVDNLANPTWTTDDTTNAPVVVSSSDSTGNTVTISVPASAPTKVFHLTVSGKNALGAAVSATVAVGILGAATQSVIITQTS